jgi:hypothetical protein
MRQKEQLQRRAVLSPSVSSTVNAIAPQWHFALRLSAMGYTPFLTSSAAFTKTSSSTPSPFCLPSLTS